MLVRFAPTAGATPIIGVSEVTVAIGGKRLFAGALTGFLRGDLIDVNGGDRASRASPSVVAREPSRWTGRRDRVAAIRRPRSRSRSTDIEDHDDWLACIACLRPSPATASGDTAAVCGFPADCDNAADGNN
jgi:hypothetical protein